MTVGVGALIYLSNLVNSGTLWNIDLEMIDFVYCRLKKTHSSYTKKTLFTHRKKLFTGVYVSLVAISVLGRVRKRQNKLFTKSNKMPIIMLRKQNDSERHNKILLCMCKHSFLVFNRLTLHLFASKISNISYSIIIIWSRLSFESVSMPPVSKSSFNNLSPLAVVLFVDETYNLQILQARKTRRSLRLSQ